MGKFMKNSRTRGDVALMEVVSKAPLGVKTRAQSKTLALQSSNNPLYPSPPSVTPAGDEGGSYLQLRSRRLARNPERSSKREKRTVEETCAAPNPNPNYTQEPNLNLNLNLNSNFRACSRVRNSSRSCSISAEIGDKSSMDFEAEVSFGDKETVNLELEIEGGDRITKESAPDSPTHPDYSSTGTIPSSRGFSHPFSPIAREIDEFFARVEKEQQKQFIKKYNFDPVNDKPLPGRYQWEKVNH